MTPVQQNIGKAVSKEPCKHWILRFGPIIVLSFWFMIFLNFAESLENGLTFASTDLKKVGSEKLEKVYIKTYKCSLTSV